MKTIIIGLSTIFMLTATPLFAQNTEPDQILGIWQTAAKDGRIELYKTGKTYSGKLIWGASMFGPDGVTAKKDVNNPDPALKTRTLQSLPILTGFSYKNGLWDDGKIYDPDSGKTYSCTMKLKNGSLEIRGYVGLSLFGRTVVWHRTN